MKTLLPEQEEDALRRILRHHGVELTDKLVKDLAALMIWVHQLEQSRSRITREGSPAPMLSFLGGLGIYGGEAIGPTPPSGVAQ